MIEVKCYTTDVRKLTGLRAFQGGLKKRTEADVAAITETLAADGLLTPFIIWQAEDGTEYLLDGHGRQQAAVNMALDDPSIMEQEFPVVVVKAATEDEAKQQLLLINSSYGKITRQGFNVFTQGVNPVKLARIKLPAFKLKTNTDTGTEENKPRPEKKPLYTPFDNGSVRMVLRVRSDTAGKLRELLSRVDGVEII